MTLVVAIPTTDVIAREGAEPALRESIVFFGWHRRCSEVAQRGGTQGLHLKQKDTIMQSAITKSPGQVAAILALSTLGLAAGCYPVDSGSFDSKNPDPGCLGGATIELVRRSGICESDAVRSLMPEVGEGMEFSAEQVRTLESLCPDSPSPGVEVHMDHESVIFDFSNVVEGGQFPSGAFEGYAIHIRPLEDNALLFHAAIDTEASTLDLEDVDVVVDPERIEVNFEGISYDARGFVKVNLYFADATFKTDDEI